jgi:DNA-binding response OmpR family regulator
MVVEDEPAIASSLVRGLNEAGLVADQFQSGAAAMRAMRDRLPYDVAILDVALDGDVSGVDICRYLRRDGAPTAILMLSAHDEVGDRLRGFDAGADDYLAKPFAFEEVLARVRALSRRKIAPPNTTSLSVGDVHCDPVGRSVLVGDSPLVLTRKEHDVLELLLRHDAQFLTREQIHDAIWSYDADPESGLVEVYVGRLRRKLRAAAARVTITNSRGVGYRMIDEGPCPA